jgi:transposase-like protein
MQRKGFGAEFKAKVALEALADRRTVNAIAGAYEVQPHQVATGKREAQEGLIPFPNRYWIFMGDGLPFISMGYR